MATKKILIAYFSRKGNNYAGGEIVNLHIGNTAVMAKHIQELAGGEMFQIDTTKSYPDDYDETTKIAAKELKEQTRPALGGKFENMDSYDTVFIGYPIWWGTFPMAVFTFLEAYDFSGKTICPFCTHEGSGLGKSIKDISKLCPKSNILEGLAVRGSNAKSSQSKVREWLDKIKI